MMGPFSRQLAAVLAGAAAAPASANYNVFFMCVVQTSFSRARVAAAAGHALTQPGIREAICLLLGQSLLRSVRVDRQDCGRHATITWRVQRLRGRVKRDGPHTEHRQARVRVPHVQARLRAIRSVCQLIVAFAGLRAPVSQPDMAVRRQRTARHADTASSRAGGRTPRKHGSSSTTFDRPVSARPTARSGSPCLSVSAAQLSACAIHSTVGYDPGARCLNTWPNRL